MAKVISVAILEDDPIMQARLADIMRAWHFIKNVVAVDSNAKLLDAISQDAFDVLLADVSVTDGNGIESVINFKRKFPDGIVIMISSNSNSDVIIDSIKAGAIGYVYKDDSQIEIIQAVRSALRNESPISPNIAFKILNELQVEKAQNSVMVSKPVSGRSGGNLLSQREAEIINYISKGMSNQEIADILGISKNTVPVHIRNIYRKLGAARRTEAVFEARSLGLII